METWTAITFLGISAASVFGFTATVVRMWASNERAKAELTVNMLLDWTNKLDHIMDRCFLLSKSLNKNEIEGIWKKQSVKIRGHSSKTILEGILGKGNLEVSDDCILLSESETELIEFNWKKYINRVEFIVTAWNEYLVDEKIMFQQFGRFLYNTEGKLSALLKDVDEEDYKMIKIFLEEKLYLQANRRPKRTGIFRIFSR